MAKEIYIAKIEKDPKPASVIRFTYEAIDNVTGKKLSDQELRERFGDTINLLITSTEGPNKSYIEKDKLIGYDINKETGKENPWEILNRDGYREVDNVIYAAPVVRKAIPITREIPKWVKEALGSKVNFNERGEVEAELSWGMANGKVSKENEPAHAYWVYYGPGDVGILKMEDTAADAYKVCTREGKEICPLAEYNQNLGRNKGPEPGGDGMGLF